MSSSGRGRSRGRRPSPETSGRRTWDEAMSRRNSLLGDGSHRFRASLSYTTASSAAAQRLWITLLAGPPGTLLHGLTAAAQDGYRGFSPDQLGVVIPAGSRAGKLRSSIPTDWNVAVRWSSQLTELDVNKGAVPPRTRLARSLVDAASERVAERRARAILLSGRPAASRPASTSDRGARAAWSLSQPGRDRRVDL